MGAETVRPLKSDLAVESLGIPGFGNVRKLTTVQRGWLTGVGAARTPATGRRTARENFILNLRDEEREEMVKRTVWERITKRGDAQRVSSITDTLYLSLYTSRLQMHFFRSSSSPYIFGECTRDCAFTLLPYWTNTRRIERHISPSRNPRPLISQARGIVIGE